MCKKGISMEAHEHRNEGDKKGVLERIREQMGVMVKKRA